MKTSQDNSTPQIASESSHAVSSTRDAAERPGALTFLFTDIEASTVRWERYPGAMQTALAEHDQLVRNAIEGCGGSVFKTVGDAFCAEFANVDDAVRAAVTMQRVLAEVDFSAVEGIRVRVAIHTGYADRRDGDHFGLSVNRVARLLSIGHGGQILLSGTARELLDASKHPGIEFVDLGTHRLKDLSRSERVSMVVVPELAERFPPLRSFGALAHNIPPQLTSFVGREREIAEITELVRNHPLVTLTGSGGTGKTRTSLYVAAKLAESLGSVWFVELAGITDHALIPLAIASTVGIPLRGEGDRLEALVTELRMQSMLLVLDNCEHLIEHAASTIARILQSCAEVKILASSRQPLSIPGERAYRMPSLATPSPMEPLSAERARSYAAVVLFVDRAFQADRRFELTDSNAPIVAEICRRLDGIALAIELAAVRVRVLSLGQIRSRLDERFRVLVGSDRSAIPRQKTLRALIDWSYDLLSEEERRTLRDLSAFAGTFTLAAAEHISAEQSGADVIDLLAGLVDKSLVVAEGVRDGEDEGDMRYRLLESIREYASEKSTLAGERAAVQGRLLVWAIDRAGSAHAAWETSSTEIWQRSYAEDLDNIRAAFVWALEHRNDVPGGLRLAATSRRFWGRVASSEGSRWLALAQSLLDFESPRATRAAICLAQAQLFVALRQHQPALEAARRAIEEYGALDEAVNLAEAKMYAGYTLGYTGNGTEAKALLREAVDVFQRHGARQLSAYSLHDLALLYLTDVNPARARSLFGN
ncbi:MAG: adenylate/guanylate cyclase domain-containing protein, partial [Candidatus Eremiobacteraeota bacterium]|nr:adenylate/guanylate cyclase domain-containing protein [Candidatus Eremiobacteraeota bacterium]